MKQDLSEMPEILKKEMVVADRNPFLPEIWEEIGDYQIALNQFLESNHSEKTFFEHNLIFLNSHFQLLVNRVTLEGVEYYERKSRFLIAGVGASTILGNEIQGIGLQQHFTGSRLREDGVEKADLVLVNLLCNAICFSIKMTGNALQLLFPESQKTFLKWRLAFLDFVNQLERYAVQEHDSEWSCELERSKYLEEISVLNRKVCDLSQPVRDILSKVERSKKRIGRFTIYRNGNNDISEIVSDGNPGKMYTFERRATKILDRLLEAYRRERVTAEDIDIRLSQSHCIICETETEFLPQKGKKLFPKGDSARKEPKITRNRYYKGKGIRQSVAVIENWLGEFLEKDSEALAQWRKATLEAVDLLEEYTEKVLDGGTRDGLYDRFRNAEYAMFGSKREIAHCLHKRFRAAPRRWESERFKFSVEDNPRKLHRPMPRIDHVAAYTSRIVIDPFTLTEHHSTRKESFRCLSLEKTCEKIFFYIHMCLNKGSHTPFDLEKRVRQDKVAGWVPIEKGWRQAFLSRRAEDRKPGGKPPRIPSADEFYKEQIEQRQRTESDGKIVSEWRIIPDAASSAIGGDDHDG